MFIYCICTQYLVGAPFALITASIRHGMEVISLWHCWGGMESQVSLTVAFSSSAFFGLLFLIFLLTIPHIFSMGFRSGEFDGQSSTPPPWSFNHGFGAFGSVGRCQILLENEISIFKKPVNRRKHEVLQNLLVNGCSNVGFQKTQWPNTSRWHCTPNHHRLWKRNTGLHATWAMSFSTLPSDSRILVWTLDHWATVQFFFSLAQVRRLWRCLWFSSGLTRGIRQLYPNSLTRLCVVALDALTPASVHSLWSSPKFLNRFCLTILIRLRFSRLVVHLFLPHFFLPLNFLLTCLDTALCDLPTGPAQIRSWYPQGSEGSITLLEIAKPLFLSPQDFLTEGISTFNERLLQVFPICCYSLAVTMGRRAFRRRHPLVSDCSTQSDCGGCWRNSTRVRRLGNLLGEEKGTRIPGWGGMAPQAWHWPALPTTYLLPNTREETGSTQRRFSVCRPARSSADVCQRGAVCQCIGGGNTPCGVSPHPQGAQLALGLVLQGDGIHYPVGQPLLGDSLPFLLTSVADKSCSELLKLWLTPAAQRDPSAAQPGQ